MKEISIKENQILFFISYGIFLTLNILKITFYFQYFLGMVFNLGVLVCALLLFVNELIFGRATDRGIFSIILYVLFIGVLVLVHPIEYKVIAATCLYIFSARNIPFRKIALFSVILSAALLVFVIASSYVGIIPNHTILREDSDAPRAYLGFLYAAYPSTIMLNITLLIFYLRKEKIRWISILLLFLCNYWLFTQTDSRLPMLLAVFTLVICGLLKLKPDFLVRKKRLTAVLAMAFLICALISILASVHYDPDIAGYEKMNSLLTGRLYYQHEGMTRYPVTLFGQELDVNGMGLDAFGKEIGIRPSDYFYIDNLYILWLLGSGLVFFVMVILLFTIVSLKSRYYDPQGYLLIVFVVLAVLCMIQDSFLFIYSNTFLLCIGEVLTRNWRKERLSSPVPDSC